MQYVCTKNEGGNQRLRKEERRSRCRIQTGVSQRPNEPGMEADTEICKHHLDVGVRHRDPHTEENVAEGSWIDVTPEHREGHRTTCSGWGHG